MPDPADMVDGARSDRPIKVFISYAHENNDHVQLVEQVAAVLKAQGMTVFLDNWRKHQRHDWNALTTTEIETADYVVAVVSPGLHAAAQSTARRVGHRAVTHEVSVMRDLLQEDRALWFPRIVPLVLNPWTVADIPRFLQPTTGTYVLAREVSEHGLRELIELLNAPRPNVPRPTCWWHRTSLAPKTDGAFSTRPLRSTREQRRCAHPPRIAGLWKDDPVQSNSRAPADG
jgi:hypothetical protein